MSRLVWSPAALLDVQRRYRFLAEKNPDAAQRAIKTIRTEVRVLASRPEIGRPLDDMDPEFREWLVDFGDSGYVALYRYDGQPVLILAIRHLLTAGKCPRYEILGHLCFRYRYVEPRTDI